MIHKIFISLSLAYLMIVAFGCGSEDDNNGDIVYKDSVTNLSWSNSEGGCKPLMSSNSKEETVQVAKDFCETLDFAGFDDWRIATTDEMQGFLEKSFENNVSLYYSNPKCKRLLSIDGEDNITSVTTHNSLPVGRDVGYRLPSGIRCVR